MTKIDVRILYGKLTGMEADLKEVYRATRRIEEWITGMKKLLESVEENEQA